MQARCVVLAAALQLSCENPGTIREPEEIARASMQEDASEEADPPFSHPYAALAEFERGQRPLFDRLDSPSGRRYMVGQGGYVLAEGSGAEVSFPPIVTMREVDPPSIDDIPPLPHATLLSPEVQQILEDSPSSIFDVYIEVQTGEPGLQHDLDRAVADGHVQSWTDYYDFQDILRAERDERVSQKKQPLLEYLGAIAVTDIPLSDGVWFQASGEFLLGLATAADQLGLKSLHLLHEPEGGSLAPDGTELRQATQAKLLLDNGYDGETTTTGADVLAAIVEYNRDGAENPVSFNITHPAYGDCSNCALDRIAGLWECDGNAACSSVSSFSEPPGNHATHVAGSVLGDYMDNQDRDVTGIDQERGSGFAPEAQGHLYLVDGGNGTISAFNHIKTLSPLPHVVNASLGWIPNEGKLRCAGDFLPSVKANELYQEGVAVFVGAGNGGGSSSSCQVLSPADAIGSFAVGAHLSDLSSSNNAPQIRTSPIYNSGTEASAYGGNSTQGQNRSIVSIAAPGRRFGRTQPDGSLSLTSASGAAAATSLATTVVSGSAMALTSWFMRGGSAFIDHPGNLYAMLLLMGDRQTVGSSKATAGFDHRWGAGRLRIRAVGSSLGLDAPYYWYHYVSCVSHGGTWALEFPDPLPSDIETVKAAAYWYDVRHGSTGAVANVDMQLITQTYLVRANDNDAFDNKAFVFEDDLPSHSGVELRLIGTNVSGHNDPICGSNAIAVHLAVFLEDSDRESPTYDPATGYGVFPEHL